MLDHVRMTVIPRNGGETTISKITEAEACAIKNNVFMRGGNVSIQTIENGYQINDANGMTLLVAVFKEKTDEK